MFWKQYINNKTKKYDFDIEMNIYCITRSCAQLIYKHLNEKHSITLFDNSQPWITFLEMKSFFHPRAGGNIQMCEVFATDVEWLLIEN